MAGTPLKYLNVEQGLSNSSATCITQDAYGFIWIGTYDGLNRYDGFDFKIFRNVWGDEQSLVNNHVKAILAVENRVYTGTEKGLTYFDYKDFRFHPLYLNDGKKLFKFNFNVNQLCKDKAGNVYVACGRGLFKINKQDTVGVKISGSNQAVASITLDDTGRLWVFVYNAGLGVFDFKTKAIKILNSSIASASNIVADGADNVWIGSGTTLYTFQASTRRLNVFKNDKLKLGSANISDLLITKNRELWVATNGGGLHIWNPLKNAVRQLQPGEGQTALKSGAVAAIFEDKEQRKWIATLRGGLNIVEPVANPFKWYSHDPFNPNSVPSNFVRSFCEDEEHNLWIGTDGSGLSYWDRSTNTYHNYFYAPNTGAVSSNFVVSIVKDFTNKIWIASFNGGIDLYDRKNGWFKHYPCIRPGTNNEEKNFWKLYEDSEHRLWASATWGGAMYLFNRTKDRFELFDARLVDIHTIFEDHLGQLWGGDYTQLIRIDPNKKQHVTYHVGQAVRAIAEDANKKLWIGTEGGGLLTLNKGKFKRYTEKDGLPSNSVLNILIDNRNNLWLSTYNGLVKYNQRQNRFVSYFASDGLQSNQFLYNSAIKLQSGEMAFGGIKGFNIFNPDSVRSKLHQPALQLTDLRVDDVPITSTPYAETTPLNQLKELRVPFSHATLAIHFAALEYSYPEKIRFAYKLEGWDQKWNYVGKLRSAYFSRLNEGDYTLKIKATNTEGSWGAVPLILKIVVLPPWYRTWWAYLLYVALTSFSVYSFWRYRRNQLSLKYEIRIANLEREKEKEANERKLSFFTNVSHEFRTPLTLIINPVKDLLKQGKQNNEELNIVYRNAKRLLGLVDHLLLFRKTETENAEMKISRVNFVELCREVYICFIHQAKTKQINYTFQSEKDEMLIFADAAKIEIALFNLISNAFKFTQDNGSISINIIESAVGVCFEIADSGIGIPEGIGEKLFEKYYQTTNKHSMKMGFGIGLYLVKTFAESHDGSVNYRSVPGAGTTFTLSLPKESKLLNGQEEFESPAIQHAVLADELMQDEQHPVADSAPSHLELLISDEQSILVIDDNQDIRNYISKIFASEYQMYEADNGELGLELIRKHLPDVIISDIVMPGLNGLELCHAVKQDSSISHIPIILLTGEAEPQLKLKGFEEGAIDFISKPFDKEILIARVKGIIKNKKELQNYFYSEVTLKGNRQNISEEHKAFLYRCIEIIESALTESNFEVNNIADKLGMSYSNLYKKVKTVTGLSINAFVRYIRLRKAAEIMINTNCNVNEAAFRVGYSDIKYFREHFNKQFGMNPSEFIKRHRLAFQKTYRLQRLTDAEIFS